MTKTKFDAKKLSVLRNKFGWNIHETMLRLHDVGLDVAPDTVSNWEDGEHTPNGAALPYLVKVFQLDSIDDLFTNI